jgi:integrase
MASRDGIQKRVNGDGSITYRAQIRVRGFPPLSKSFHRRTDAKQWIEETKTAIRGGSAVSNEAQRTTLRDALDRYLREVTPTKKGKLRERGRVKAWMSHSLAFRYLSQLRGSDFATYRDERRAEGKAENTIRIELALISRLYKTAARDWGMEGLRNPIANITMPAGSNQRDRRLVDDEEKTLFNELHKRGPYMQPLAEFAIETAMRQGELLSLTWADVDLQKRVASLKDTKNSEPRDVPLSTRALVILKTLPRPIDSMARVFPLEQDHVIRSFRQACNDAVIGDLKFHDLRHEAVSRICDKLPMHEAMRVTGHKTPAMLMRYYHPKAEDLARKLG